MTMTDMKRFELYNGSRIITMDSRHIYRTRVPHPDGTPGKTRSTTIPNVTSVINKKDKSRRLIPWATGMASNYWADMFKPGQPLTLDEPEIERHREAGKWANKRFAAGAANIGSIVHDYAEKRLYDAKIEMPANAQARHGAEAFDAWLSQHRVEPYEIERCCLSSKHWYVGTADLLANIDGVLTIADFKSSKSIYDEVLLQLAAYQKALEEELGCQIEQRMVIRFDKESGDFEVATIPADDLEHDFACFLHLLGVYDWDKTAWSRLEKIREAA